MAYYSTIQESIDGIYSEETSYRNLHNNIYVKNLDHTYKIAYGSIIRKYIDFFRVCVVELPLTNQEISLYRFKPKKLSYDLYGTTELWSSLLEINNLYSVIEFNLEKVKVFEPKEFQHLLNEVLIMEGIIQ